MLLVLQESVDLGEIMYSLCYLPTAGRMTLTVIKCRNLKAMDITGSSGELRLRPRLRRGRQGRHFESKRGTKIEKKKKHLSGRRLVLVLCVRGNHRVSQTPT